MNVTDIIAEVKADFCRNYCKYAEECDARMANNEEQIPCPLDKL